jgi:hypothetical protein
VDIAIESDSSVGVDVEVASGALKSLGFIGFYATVKGWAVQPKEEQATAEADPYGMTNKRTKQKDRQWQEQEQPQIPCGDDKQKGKTNEHAGTG